jgi:hypothetical protein
MFFSGAANAAYCDTKVNYLFIDNTGLAHAYLHIKPGYVAFCNLNTNWKNISPVTCAGWVSMIRSAVARSAGVRFYYAESFKCTEIPDYQNAPSPGYIMLND